VACVTYAGFYAETCQSKGAQGEEASRGITTAARGREEGGAKCIATVHIQSCWEIMRDDEKEMTL